MPKSEIINFGHRAVKLPQEKCLQIIVKLATLVNESDKIEHVIFIFILLLLVRLATNRPAKNWVFGPISQMPLPK